MNISTKHSDTHSSYGTRIQPGNLKLKSQKIVEFMGKMDEWQRWNSKTECSLYGSVYERVLKDATYDALNTQMNRVVYSQLEVETFGGTSHQLIKQHKDNKNGYGAWNTLCE